MKALRNIADGQDSFGTSWMIECQQGVTLGLEYIGETYYGYAFHWSGLSLSDTMSPLLAFMLSRTTSLSTPGTV